MLAIKADQILKMSKGIANDKFNHDEIINNIIIDSRQASKNSLFVAVKGENHDGHNYLAKVVCEPTNFAMVDETFISDLPNLIRVKDTTKALGVLASNYRQLFNIPIVAITGSNGKTSVKEMLRSVCICEFGTEQVLANIGSLNNHWGTPLTLLELNQEHKVAIIEMGMNHSGELTYLSKLTKPTMAIINNVMFAHAGFFKSINDIAAAKGEIYSGLSNDGLACVDVSSQFSSSWLDYLTKHDIPVFKYGAKDTNCYIKEINFNSATYVTPQGEITISLKILGQHAYVNALTVIVLALNLRCSLSAIKKGLESYQGYKSRLERKIAFNGAIIIDDSYNANPDSVKAALQAIQELPKPYWVILSDMKELGKFELEFHKEIGLQMNEYQISKLLTVGDLAKHAAKYFRGDKIHFAHNQDIVQYCLLNLPQEAVVLVKGSKATHIYEVVEKLL